MTAEILNITDYKTFRDTLGAELRSEAEGFVRIGYLLKQARDTDILSESGYRNITEFAQTEYGLTKDIVSRYIAINDKYSVNGYSNQLKEEYQGYGYAKLAEMLTLPASVVEEMNPELTKSEIREIKEAVKEEEKISDIEVAIEAAEKKSGNSAECKGGAAFSLLEEVIREVLHLHPEKFCDIRVIMTDIYDDSVRVSRISDVLSSAGYMLYTVRIKGVGTILFKCETSGVSLTNVRTNEKTKHEWSEVEYALDFVTAFTDEHSKVWEKIYEEAFPQAEEKKEKVAPAQPQSSKPEKKENKKSHVSTSVKKEKEKEKKKVRDAYAKIQEKVKVEQNEEEPIDAEIVVQQKEKTQTYLESIKMNLSEAEKNMEYRFFDVASECFRKMNHEIEEICKSLEILIKANKEIEDKS